MAGSPSVDLEVAGRTVRISNPDKIYFPERGVHQARRRHLLPQRGRRHPAGPARATDHTGALAERRGRGDEAVHPGRQPGRRVLPEAPAHQGRAAVGRVGRDQLPQWAQGRRALPGRPGPRGLGGPARARSCSTRGRSGVPMWTHPTSCASTSTRSPGTDFADAAAAADGGPRGARRAGLGRLSRRPPAGVGYTSTSASLHGGRSSRSAGR